MQIKFPLIIFSLLVGLFTFSELVQAEQSSTIYLTADSTLDNTQQNTRDKNAAT
ncbi:hypothetical protein [Methylomonas sp. AM2-LC]|uniref:hypothetical protein n=1 Tax=Methylomonas sp. AM2-LC TaxID=3153301 RepID=UPI003264770D